MAKTTLKGGGRIKIGSWTIEEECPPVPLFVFNAWHENYDGLGDPRLFMGSAHRTLPPDLGRMIALKKVVDQIVEYEEEHRG